MESSICAVLGKQITKTKEGLTLAAGLARRVVNIGCQMQIPGQERKVKFLDKNACFAYSSYFCKEGNGLPYQVSCWKKKRSTVKISVKIT